MNLSDLQRKDVVQLETGKKLGKIIDAKVTEQGMIEYFVVLDHKFWQFWKSNNELNIKINEIEKIGTDVILVNL